tara:strand:- start:1452 stop:1664 length:213 start_codon:yes stop_codon:yes gene_type:complete
MIRNGMRPIHPGEILREEYLEPLDMSVNALSNALHVPATRMNEIVRENRGVAQILLYVWLDTSVRASVFG